MELENFLIDGLYVSYYTNSSQNVKILFVHGAWHSSYCWEKFFLPYFSSKGYSVYALNLRSHGKSNSKGYYKFNSLNSYLADVHTVIEKIKEDSSVILIAHSMGGMVVQKYLVKYPNTVTAAILLAPATTWGVRSTTFSVMFHHPLQYMKMNILFTLRPLVSKLSFYKYYFFYSETNDETIQEYQNFTTDESYRAYINMFLDKINYKRISQPVLIIGGKNDHIFKPKHLEKLNQKIKDSKMKLYDQTGHNLMLEKDWQSVADTSISWIINSYNL